MKNTKIVLLILIISFLAYFLLNGLLIDKDINFTVEKLDSNYKVNTIEYKYINDYIFIKYINNQVKEIILKVSDQTTISPLRITSAHKKMVIKFIEGNNGHAYLKVKLYKGTVKQLIINNNNILK